MSPRSTLVAILFCLVVASPTTAELPILSEEMLTKFSAEIVEGKVLKITAKDPKGKGFRRVDYVAEIEVAKSVKGDIKRGDVIKVAYYNQVGPWPRGLAGTRGHDSRLIKKDAKIRVYLGGGREILCPNGIRAIKTNK